MIDTESLEKLHQLKSQGIITENEFEQAKQRILAGPPRRDPAKAAATVLPRPSEEDLIGWMLLPLRRYADFTGRSCRREFWTFQLAYVMIAVTVLAGIAGTGLDIFAKLLFLSAVLASIALVVPQIALQVRRFHDQDRSGLFVLINLVPYVGFIIVYAMMLIEGTKGDNQYGPDPLS